MIDIFKGSSAATGNSDVLDGGLALDSGLIFSLTGTGWTGTVKVAARVRGRGTAGASTFPGYLPIVNLVTGAVVLGSTGVAADGLYAVNTSGLEVRFEHTRAAGSVVGYGEFGSVPLELFTAALAGVAISGTVTLGAGEAHAAEVGSADKIIKIAQTVTAALYSVGNAVGGLITLSNACRAAGHSTILQHIGITDVGNQKAPIDFLVFDANPTASTITDKAAFVLHANDVDKVIARISVAASDYTTVGGVAFASAANLSRILEAASGVDLFAAAVTSGTPTYTATSNVKLRFGFMRN